MSAWHCLRNKRLLSASQLGTSPLHIDTYHMPVWWWLFRTCQLICPTSHFLPPCSLWRLMGNCALSGTWDHACNGMRRAGEQFLASTTIMLKICSCIPGGLGTDADQGMLERKDMWWVLPSELAQPSGQQLSWPPSCGDGTWWKRRNRGESQRLWRGQINSLSQAQLQGKTGDIHLTPTTMSSGRTGPQVSCLCLAQSHTAACKVGCAFTFVSNWQCGARSARVSVVLPPKMMGGFQFFPSLSVN